MKPFWITFYSYKGGVGRTLALANIAALLVQRGRRVVLIDFDLEAPGLDSFAEFRCIAGKPGVVEYVSEFKDAKRAPDISQFVQPCDLESKPRGKLWIMPAGKKDARYNVDRVKLDWAELYESGLGEPFVENWKAAIGRHCQPDYVFVDSRTGLTDVGGICTLHLPDLVVMLFALNEQNVCGVAAVAKTIRESHSSRLPQVHYVASPVPNLPRDKTGPLDQRWTAASQRIGTKIKSSIRYHHVAALSERLYVLDPTPDPSTLFMDYWHLLDRLLDYNRGGLDFLVQQTASAIANDDAPLKDRLIATFEQEFPHRPEALMARAELKNALGDPSAATALAREALDADPAFEFPLDWLLRRYRRAGDHRAGLSLCTLVLHRSDQLPPTYRYEINAKRGQLAMAAGEHEVALESYQACVRYHLKDQLRENKKGEIVLERFTKTHTGETDVETFAKDLFDLSEASRRSTGQAQNEIWSLLIDLFKSTGGASDAPLVLQANRWQAMHIPLAMTGDLPRAREALAKARQAAERLGPAEDVFSVKTYTEVQVPEFLQINDEMLAALDRGQLWDGMPIPKEKPPEESAPKAPEPTPTAPKAPTPPKPEDPARPCVTRRFQFED